MSSVGAARFVGQSVVRVEDGRILTGRGRYMDDIVLPGMLEGVFLRSDLGHARIASIDAARARSMPGVVAVITATELEGAVFPLQVPAEIPNYLRPVFHALADEKVRYVGDPIAFVVAESRYLAEDARDAVEVEYEPLDAVVTMDQAADPALPPLFDDVGSNVFYTEAMNFGEPDAAFAEADRVVSAMIDSARVTHVPMEGRGGVADYRAGTDELTYHAGSQAPHAVRQAPGRPAGASGRALARGDPRHRRGLRAEGRAVPRGPRRVRRRQDARSSGEMGRGPRSRTSPRPGRRARRRSRSPPP